MCGARFRAVALGTLVILVLTGCAEVSQNPKTTIGALGGAAVATHQALETTASGKSVPWNNPDNGHAGTVRPVHTYQTPNGAYCREYETLGAGIMRLTDLTRGGRGAQPSCMDC